MDKSVSALLDRVQREAAKPGLMCTGRLVSMDEQGRPQVCFEGSGSGAVLARSIVAVAPPALWPVEGIAVLLMLDHGDAGSPIIVGTLSDRLIIAESNPSACEAAAVMQGRVLPDVPAAKETLVATFADGKRVCIEAAEEVTLKCGKSAITLRADGRITTRGVEIVSRASGANKVKGASVSIN